MAENNGQDEIDFVWGIGPVNVFNKLIPGNEYWNIICNTKLEVFHYVFTNIYWRIRWSNNWRVLLLLELLQSLVVFIHNDVIVFIIILIIFIHEDLSSMFCWWMGMVRGGLYSATDFYLSTPLPASSTIYLHVMHIWIVCYRIQRIICMECAYNLYVHYM